LLRPSRYQAWITDLTRASPFGTRLQIGAGPAQGVQAVEHVIAEVLIDGAKFEQVKRKAATVERGRNEQGHSPRLAAAAGVGRGAKVTVE